LRDFSAPVILEFEQSESDLLFLTKFDTNPFTAYEAIQTLAIQEILSKLDNSESSNMYYEAHEHILDEIINNRMIDFAPIALALPSVSEIGDYLTSKDRLVNPINIHHTRDRIKQYMARIFKSKYKKIYNKTKVTKYNINDASKRKLRNFCLLMLCSRDKKSAHMLAKTQFTTANCMTEKLAAFSALVSIPKSSDKIV
jgi:aminopeptidase N